MEILGTENGSLNSALSFGWRDGSWKTESLYTMTSEHSYLLGQGRAGRWSDTRLYPVCPYSAHAIPTPPHSGAWRKKFWGSVRICPLGLHNSSSNTWAWKKHSRTPLLETELAVTKTTLLLFVLMSLSFCLWLTRALLLPLLVRFITPTIDKLNIVTTVKNRKQDRIEVSEVITFIETNCHVMS